MKSSSFLTSGLLGTMLFCMVSCGGSADQKDKESSDEVAADTTATLPAPAPPVSTIVTTPQLMMVVQHKVTDYDKFQAAYEAHDSMRLANGIHSYVIGRGVTDPNIIFVATKVDDVEKAKAFGKSANLKQAMKTAGVTGTPTISLNIMTYQDTANLGDVLRSRTTFTVKDWDTWQRKFDSTRQVRLDNGLVDRAYGHDAENNKKVTVVVAVMDTTKAYAFWKSDQLKQMRAASGLVGEPVRFIYKVAKKY